MCDSGRTDGSHKRECVCVCAGLQSVHTTLAAQSEEGPDVVP